MDIINEDLKVALDFCASDDDSKCDYCYYGERTWCQRDLARDALKQIEDLEAIIKDKEKSLCELEAKVPKWVNPKEKLPKVPKGFKFIEVLCLYDHDGWKHCELLRFFDKKDEEFKFEPGWHQLDMFDPIMDYEDGMIGWMYLPGFPVPPEEEEARKTPSAK